MTETVVLQDNWNKKRASTPVVQKSGTPIKNIQDCKLVSIDSHGHNETSPAPQNSKYVSTIQVLIRTRPSNSIDGASCITVNPRNSTVTVRFPHTSARKIGCVSTEVFRFEGGVLDEGITQDELFAEVGLKSAVKVWDGYNVTFFAYGQTGSGKTHSMYGPGSSISQNSDERGFVARIVECLFSLLLTDSADGKQAKMSLSFIDIYDERVFDLLDPGHEKKVRESSNGVYVEGASWRPLLSVGHALSVCEEALKNRRIAETKMNSRSSRSHTLCMIKVCRDLDRLSDGLSSVRSTTAVMTLVDLCGSERVKKSDVEGVRLREAININSSLSALKSVITALGDGAAHIPYRESKLTWLLKDSIGSNGMVFIIAHLNPHEDHHVETSSTLRFVSFARTVKSQALKNERIKSADEVLLEKLHEKPETPRSREEHCGGEGLVRADQATQTSPPRPGSGSPLVARRRPAEAGLFRCRQAFEVLIRGPDLR
jgi:hypothetical protein